MLRFNAALTVMVMVLLSLGVVQPSLSRALYVVVAVGFTVSIVLVDSGWLLLAIHWSWWAVFNPPFVVALNSACSPIQMVLSWFTVSSSLGRTVMVSSALSLFMVQPSLRIAL